MQSGIQETFVGKSFAFSELTLYKRVIWTLAEFRNSLYSSRFVCSESQGSFADQSVTRSFRFQPAGKDLVEIKCLSAGTIPFLR